MHLKRSLGLAAVILAVFAILIATAGAARGPQKAHRQFHFKTPAAVMKYLKAHGVSTRGMVIQRGHRNYAGPNCPGKRWNCTKSKHVIQFTTSESSNSFYCTPSTGGTSSPPDNCVIVQVNVNGDNNAKCVESTSAAGAALNCDVTQENVNGANNAATVQLINQRSGQSQDGSENSDVHQQNGIGANNAAVLQTIWQNTFTSVSPVSQNQNGEVTNTINQNGGTSNQLSTMSQLVIQVASAGKKRDEDDGHGHDDHASTMAFGMASAAAPTPFTGNQNQFGDGRSDVTQDSTGVSKAYNFQNMFQKESAPSGVNQDQNGPFRCCSPQGSNTADQFLIQQSKTQLTSSGAASDQVLDENGFLDTTGHGHISQFENQNGSTDSNSCDVNSGACEAELAAANGESAKCTDSGSEVGCSVCPFPIPSCSEFTFSTNNAASPMRLAQQRALRVHHFK